MVRHYPQQEYIAAGKLESYATLLISHVVY